jgi:hypothetical protein
MALGLERGQVAGADQQVVEQQRRADRAALGDGETTVEPLAEREIGAAHGDFGGPFHRGGADRVADQRQGGKVHAVIAQQAPRPQGACQKHLIAADFAPFGDNPAHLPCRQRQGAHRAILHDDRALPDGGGGNRAGGQRRFGASVGGRVDPPAHVPRPPGTSWSIRAGVSRCDRGPGP